MRGLGSLPTGLIEPRGFEFWLIESHDVRRLDNIPSWLRWLRTYLNFPSSRSANHMKSNRKFFSFAVFKTLLIPIRRFQAERNQSKSANVKISTIARRIARSDFPNHQSPRTAFSIINK